MLKKIKTFFSSDRYFYGSLIILIIIIGQLPIILHYFHTPNGFYYPLLDRPSFSDFYYPAIIRYGMGAAWLLKIPYVIYDHQASLIQIFFILLGKLSLITELGPAEIFAVFRVLGGIIYAVSAVFLLKIILPKNQARLAFVLFLFAQPLPALDFLSGKSGEFDKWIWHFGEAARRLSDMPPHYTFGKGLAVLSLGFLFLYLKKRKLKYGLIAGGLIFAAGMIYPPPVFILVFSLVVAFVAASIPNFSDTPSSFWFPCFPFAHAKASREVSYLRETWVLGALSSVFKIDIFGCLTKIRGIIFYLLAALLPLLMLKIELARGYPWDMWNKVELGWNAASMQFEWGYLRMLGILVFLVLAVFLIRLLRRENFFGNLGYQKIFILVWFSSPFLLFPFANFLSLGKFRFIEGAQIVPLAVISLWGIEYIARYGNKFKRIFLFLFIANFMFFASQQVWWSTARLWFYWTNVYFRPAELTALSFLRINAKNDAIVLADDFSSNYIPAFAQVRTILGFPDFYPQFSEFKDDEQTVQNILKGKATDEETKAFISRRKADYVYYDASVYGKKELYPRILDAVFQNELIQIYKVDKQMLQ